MIDLVSAELRAIENAVDEHYKTNDLIQLPFGQAAWYFMSACEDKEVHRFMSKRTFAIHYAAQIADRFVTLLRDPFRWLASCGKGGNPNRSVDQRYYQASVELLDLAENYRPFVTAFSYASQGYTELRIDGTTLSSTHDFQRESQYEAYDRLVKPSEVTPSMVRGDIAKVVSPSVRVSGSSFSYDLNRRVVSEATDILELVLDAKYSLPEHWRFSRFFVQDFKRITKCLTVMAYLHYVARIVAVSQGCDDLGYANGIFLTSRDELINRLTRFTGCPQQVVSMVVADLTLGARGIKRLDPALQPIIRLNEKLYSFMPNLLMNSSMERNFTVLLNRIPEEKDVYARLLDEKELVMKESIKKQLTLPTVRYFEGKIGNAPPVDLVIISDTDKVCLFLELKWFIEPAEVREIIEKSEEIRKGVTQLERLATRFNVDPQSFFDKLLIDGTYQFGFALLSDAFIGLASVQHPDIPVLQQAHFVRKANSLGNLGDLLTWLSSKAYLPVEGRHYRAVEDTWRVGRWAIKWYGIEPLLQNEEFL